MNQANYFFFIFFGTILITRIFLYFKPTQSPKIKNFRLHHYMYGIVLVPIGLLTQSIILFGIGLGLFIDELTFVIMRGKSHEENYSKTSLFGTMGFMILVFLLRNYLVFF